MGLRGKANNPQFYLKTYKRNTKKSKMKNLKDFETFIWMRIIKGFSSR